MDLNKSQLLVIGTIFSATLGIINIHKVFTEEIINIVMENPSHTMVALVSILKILLFIISITWLIQLVRNIGITYRTKSEQLFKNYILDLGLTALTTVIFMIFIKIIF